MTPISHISGDTGIDVPESPSLTYLYGLSDFWAFSFEDSDVINSTLWATTSQASEVYSQFLQAASGISIADVQTWAQQSLKLVFLKSVDGLENEFILNEPIVSAKFLLNRPFLPTESLQEGSNFEFEQIDAYSTRLTLARSISEYRFPQRKTTSGVEYAAWATDVLLDKQYVQKAFGSLVGIPAFSEVSSTRLSDFIYGLHFLYLNGPSFKRMQQGLNLVLGIPISRETEPVIEVRQDTITGQYLVITQDNQYSLPVGATPDVFPGDTINLGDPLSTKIQLADFQESGEWWTQVYIPSTVIPVLPALQGSRFAISGSLFDLMFKKALKKNTFLIRISLDAAASRQQQDLGKIPELVTRSKPSYTQPVYLWEVETESSTESATASESGVTYSIEAGSLLAINYQAINEVTIG